MFAIVSQQRSGTHFLESLISSHPDAFSLGEGVLGSKDTKSNFYAYLGSLAANDPDVVRPHNLYSAWRGFLDSLAAQHPNVRRLGFILMYNQIAQIPGSLVERILQDVQIIHLVRQNVLRTHVSDYINRLTDQPAHTRQTGQLVRITLPADTLLDDLKERAQHIETMRERLSRHRHVEVTYEDLCENRDETLRRVTDFLRIPHAPLATTLQPSNPWPLAKILENYREVRDRLRGTEFEPLLDHHPPLFGLLTAPFARRA